MCDRMLQHNIIYSPKWAKFNFLQFIQMQQRSELPTIITLCLHSLRLSENRVLRRIFGSKKDEVLGGLRGLQNEWLRNLYSLPSKFRMATSWTMRWVGHVARMGQKWRWCRLLVGKQGQRPLGIPRRRWVDNINIDLEAIRGRGTGLIGLVQDKDKDRALVNAVVNLHFL
jgi:hypothetical protein